MRELGKAGVVVGFCGGGGAPLFAGTDIEWMTPMSEYRPTEYLQRWVSMWFNEEKRLNAARTFQLTRLEMVRSEWSRRERRDESFPVNLRRLAELLDGSRTRIEQVPDVTHLLAEEARVSKALYKLAVDATDYGEFVRAKQGSGSDPANRFLDHGNYLAYGLGATAAWVLGIPAALAVLHGKTRRGGLVFDIADLIKDAFVLPEAFAAAKLGAEDQEFRVGCIESLTRGECLDFMIDTVKRVAEQEPR